MAKANVSTSPGQPLAEREPASTTREGSAAETDASVALAPQRMSADLMHAVDLAMEHPAREVPQMQLARTLEEAGPKTFVYIDSQGRVRPPTQYRMMQAASYAMLTTILVGGSVLYTYLWGVMGLLFPLVFGSLVGRNLLVTRRINQAALLSSHDRLDEALGTNRIGELLQRLLVEVAPRLVAPTPHQVDRQLTQIRLRCSCFTLGAASHAGCTDQRVKPSPQATLLYRHMHSPQ